MQSSWFNAAWEVSGLRPCLSYMVENANNNESKTHPTSISMIIFPLVLLIVVLHMFNVRLLVHVKHVLSPCK